MTAKKSICGAYIFIGPENGKKQAAINELRKKMSEPEETVFYAGETPAAQIVSIVQNHSLFAQSRLFIIKNADQIKEKEAALIASCMKELEDDTIVILVSDEIKLAAGLMNACPKEKQQIFYELFENQKSEWVRSFFLDEGYRIEPDGIDTILEFVANDTESLRRECSKLMLFLPKDRPASAEDVEQWLVHSREETPFSLFSRIAAGDTSRAVESLHTMLAAGESVTGILAGLAACYKKLRDYLALLENGEPNNVDTVKKIGVFMPKAKTDYVNAARRCSAAHINTCLALTAEYDIQTRGASDALWKSVLMDVYLLKVMGNGE
jgi:DNA polymerase-3 subunit delta